MPKKKQTPTARLLHSLEQAVDYYVHGDQTKATESIHRLVPNNIKALRKKSGLSKTLFCIAFGIDTKTLRKWEQGRGTLSKVEYMLIAVMNAYPEAVPQTLSYLGHQIPFKRPNRPTKKLVRNIGGVSSKSRTKKFV